MIRSKSINSLEDIIRHEQFAADEKSLIIEATLESINLGNQRLLHQALSNLLINAIKYKRCWWCH